MTAPPPVVTDAFRAVVTERSSIEIVSAVPRNAPAQAARFDVAARSGAGRGGGALGGVLARPPVRWRVSANTIVERSSDDGQTWTTVVIDPPAFLTAGSAPFQDVCWLVGRDGVVLRSTDGLMFGRVTVPAPVALIAVTATDALGAIVTAVDGRVFVTTDGGVTWVVR